MEAARKIGKMVFFFEGDVGVEISNVVLDSAFEMVLREMDSRAQVEGVMRKDVGDDDAPEFA